MPPVFLILRPFGYYFQAYEFGHLQKKHGTRILPFSINGDATRDELFRITL